MVTQKLTVARKRVKAPALAIYLFALLPHSPLAVIAISAVSVSSMATLAYKLPAKAELNQEQKNQKAWDFILKNGSYMAKIMGDKKISRNKKRLLLKDNLDENLNTRLMTRAIIGKYWRAMNEQQQKQYTLAASQWIVLFSANLLSSLTSASFEVIASKLIGKDVLVETSVQQQEGRPALPVGWRVRFDKNGEPSLIDVHIRGLSIVSAQRGEAGAILAESGLEGFLDKLDTRLESIKKEFQKNN